MNVSQLPQDGPETPDYLVRESMESNGQLAIASGRLRW